MTARIGRYSELSASEITNAMRNPSQIGEYWLGTTAVGNGVIYQVYSDGRIISCNYFGAVNNSDPDGDVGIRPLVIIKP